MQRLCCEAACFTVLRKTRERELLLVPEQEIRGTWSHQQCLLVPANSDFGGVLPCWERREWPCIREVLLPEGPIVGSSLGTVKLDNQEQKQQQRRTRQVRAPNVTQDKRCLPLSQFKVLQVFKSSRLRSLILISNCNQKGRKYKTNKQASSSYL